mmetsp:Transcript_41125/g.66676  ORF Transcript_41125/g.66676 Transcript_41125/m.66676 type:complete len:92 (+) Transcript_41125:309-584(+)
MKSVSDLNLEILLVSNFTLYGDCSKNKPDYRYAMKTEKALEAWNQFVALLRQSYKTELVQEGVFGAMMNCQLVNDGPVTLVVESKGKSSDD